MPQRPTLSRRQFLAYLTAGTVSLAAGTVLWSAYHAQVTRHRLALPKLRVPFKVVQMSDLHYGPYIHEGSVQAWAVQVLEEAPDLIVITGDLVDRWLRRPLMPLAETLSVLHAPLGVWASLGNHDHSRFGDLRPLERALEAAGIGLLVNRGVRVREDLFLAGVDDYANGEPDLDRALHGAPGEAASLLLCHHPDFLPKMNRPVDLTLVGHTHGGQVRLPFVGPLTTSSWYGERFVEGWVENPNKRFRNRTYISRGLGVSLLPVRYNCPAELPVFEIFPRG